jgi:lipoate synthase
VLDLDEPRRVAEALAAMKLKHVGDHEREPRLSSPDGGAAVWAETVNRVHDACPDMSVEILVGDFQGDEQAIQAVCDSRPEIISPQHGDGAAHAPGRAAAGATSARWPCWRQFKQSGLVTKTGIMVGIGERDDEVLALLDDVRAASDADIITIGQYLQPTRNHLPIDRWVHPDQFAMYRAEALARGFNVCESGRSCARATTPRSRPSFSRCAREGDARARCARCFGARATRVSDRLPAPPLEFSAAATTGAGMRCARGRRAGSSRRAARATTRRAPTAGA